MYLPGKSSCLPTSLYSQILDTGIIYQMMAVLICLHKKHIKEYILIVQNHIRKNKEKISAVCDKCSSHVSLYYKAFIVYHTTF